jgi:hypothetical protein
MLCGNNKQFTSMSNHNKPTTGFHTNPERINKNGAPIKPWTWAGLLRESLDEKDENGIEYKVHVTKSLRLKAMEGDVQAIKEYGNRIDGLPPQSVDVTSKGEQVFSGADYIGEHNSKTDTTTT